MKLSIGFSFLNFLILMNILLCSSPEVYFNAISEEFKGTIDANEQSIYQICDLINEQVVAIEQTMGEYAYNDTLLHYRGADVNTMKKQTMRLINQIKLHMVKLHRQNDDRVNGFGEKFQKFLQNFEKMSKFCNEKWDMTVNLQYFEPALRYPIHMAISDPNLDLGYNEMTNLNHHLAALVMKLAINQTLESPFLIFDSLDYVIEPCMIK